MSNPAPAPAPMMMHQPQFAKHQMDPRQLAALEAPLIALTQQCGGDLRNVLYAFFAFLHRRTDFYLVPHDDDLKEGKATMGFREGDAEKLLLVAFRQFPLRRIPPTSQQQAQQQRQPSTTTAPSKTKVGAMATETNVNPPKGSASGEDTPDGGSQTVATALDVTVTENAANDSKKKNNDDEMAAAAAAVDLNSIRLTDDGLQIPVGNGGSTKRYKWTQTLEECSVLVGVPAGIKGKDLDVSLKRSFISVRSKKPISSSSSSASSSDGGGGVVSEDNAGVGGEAVSTGGQPHHVFLEGNLADGQAIVPSESTWSLEGGVLVLVLYKHQKTFWATVLDGDDKIDTSMVDSRRRIDDYDESTQAQIRKIMFDQSQASKGLPTSAQLTGSKVEIPLSTAAAQGKLPPGVEYIDQSTIDQYTKEQKKKKAGGT